MSLVSIWLCGLNVLVGADPQPGDAVTGVSGEFFRYSSIFMRAPTDNDRS